MRERKKPGDEDDYNKTHHVYDDPLRLVQEIQREREEISRRQDSQKVLNIDVKKTKTSPRDGGGGGKKVPPKTKPKYTTNSKLRNNHGNEITTSPSSSSSSFSVSTDKPGREVSSDVSRLPLNNLSCEPSSASNYTNTGFLSDSQENGHHVIAARTEATNVARSTLIQNFESKTTRSEQKDHVSLKQSNALPEVNRVAHLQQQFDSFKETKSSGQPTTSSTTKDQQHSGGTPDPTLLSSISVEQSTSEGTPEDGPIIVLTHSPTHSKQKQSSKESPYEVLPLRKDPAKKPVIAVVTPPEPPPPRTDHEKIDGSQSNDSSGKGTSRQSADTPPATLPDGEVELGLGANPTVVVTATVNHASNSSLTSSTAKNIVDMIRRRRKRRFLLLLITLFLFIMLVGVASVAVYLVSLNSPSDEDTLQISHKETENYDSNR